MTKPSMNEITKFLESAHPGVGVDIIELARFRKINFLARVAEFVLTPTEYKTFASHPDALTFFASRFAVKEAVIKAYPTRLTYRDVETYKEGDKLRVRLLCKQLRRTVAVSLSHSTEYVAGFAITQ